MPKLCSPFVRKEINGKYVVIPEIAEGYEWVFNDDNVWVEEKLHGTNVSIIIENSRISRIFNRTKEIDFWTSNKGDMAIIDGIRNAKSKGYCNFTDGQYFGELIGPKFFNKYHEEEHIWIPYEIMKDKNLYYKSWGKYPKDFETISNWFKELMPLYNISKGYKDGFVEGVVFKHPDGRMAKLRCDMFDWYKGEGHKGGKQKDE